jgi:hypothetical protein
MSGDRRLCALGLCGMIAIGASAAGSPAHRGSLAAPVKTGHPAVTALHAAGPLARGSVVRPRSVPITSPRGLVAPVNRSAPLRAKAAPRGPIIGGPHPSGAGRLGGPAMGQTRRKF